ncbi:helix-turn-helix domain-containing protein [Azospirillum isscasi]|uniref:AraC family transcriptional regulator n=1 Tax=Azospirillum isscasi TaxID=3053926 RepID=A0ABU0WHB4_9PROT|nr:AraC family transcriptional regulator [Azospirillum isscasi]MDQ2103603.1 AraC family transcriptional regulator [Azospirillum isscasi]
MPSTPSARLLPPRPALAACVFFGVERDTRGTALPDDQRFNHYPATPMSMISWIFDGVLHMVEERGGDGCPLLGPPLPRLVLSGPQRRPVASWSPGPVHALSVAFYPDALGRLSGIGAESLVDRVLPLEDLVSGPLLAACESLFEPEAGGGSAFDRMEARLEPLWSGPGARDARLAPLMRDWLRTLGMRAALSRTGRGVRQAQRRIKEWTGLSHRDLQLFARVEEVAVRAARNREGGAIDLAGLASELGFADQSHMGREVRRLTGLPPGRLNGLMATHEAFWFYRLLDESFGAW